MTWRGHALALALIGVAGPVAVVQATASSKPRPCVVPNVKGMKLTKAKTRLNSAHCATGKIIGPRTAFVSGESPKAGKHEKNRTKVALTFKRKSVASAHGQKTTSGSGGTSSTGSSGGSSDGSSGGTSSGSGNGNAQTRQPVTTVTDPTPAQMGLSGTWKLALDSEFNGGSPPSPWRTGWFGSGVTVPVTGIGNELNCYSPSNVTFPGDGSMHLRITGQSSTCGGKTEPYTGSIVTTNPSDGRPAGTGFQYTYGVLEVRVYLPGTASGQIANWPGIWTDSQTWPPENDLLEGIDGSAWSTYHEVGDGNPTRFHDPTIGPGWHTFVCDWEPGSITYWYDGIDEGTVTSGIATKPMYLILDNTTNYRFPDVAVAPADVQVAFVKLWQH